MQVAPPYDYAVLDNSEFPRSIVYDIDTSAEVAVFTADPRGQLQAEVVSSALNSLDALLADTDRVNAIIVNVRKQEQR